MVHHYALGAKLNCSLQTRSALAILRIATLSLARMMRLMNIRLGHQSTAQRMDRPGALAKGTQSMGQYLGHPTCFFRANADGLPKGTFSKLYKSPKEMR